MILVLVMNPLLNQFQNHIEQPLFIFALDDSQSMTNSDSIELNQTLDYLNQLQSKLEQKGKSIVIETLSDRQSTFSTLDFSYPETNLNTWLKNIDAKYQEDNVAAITLLSDGAYNTGSSPDYFPYHHTMHTIGIGDTTQPADLVLKNILYNKIAYQNNKFPVVVDIANYGFENTSTNVTLQQGSQVIATQKVNFQTANDIQRVEFEVEAQRSGLMGLTIKVEPLTEEKIIANNEEKIFIDVVKGKPKIAIIAPMPHPDIKALAAVIEKNQNFELSVWIPKVSEPEEKSEFDLAIVHTPYDAYNSTLKIIESLKKQKTPMLYIIGNRTKLELFNEKTAELSIQTKRNQSDRVSASLNPNFSKFDLETSDYSIFKDFPPIAVPYGEYQIPSGYESILYQNVGAIQTQKPILLVGEKNNIKSGILYGSDFWKWRMQEFATTHKTEAFDDLMMKTLKYLSTKENRKKLRTYTTLDEYSSFDAVELKAEMYNELYERVYAQEVTFQISGPDGYDETLTFTPTSAASKLDISDLSEGIYEYNASALINNKKENSSGIFSVKETKIESLDQVSNFNLLRNLSANNQGEFFTTKDLKKLEDKLLNTQHASRISSDSTTLPLIHLQWLLALLILLLSIEWFTRKYQGGYWVLNLRR